MRKWETEVQLKNEVRTREGLLFLFSSFLIGFIFLQTVCKTIHISGYFCGLLTGRIMVTHEEGRITCFKEVKGGGVIGGTG